MKKIIILTLLLFPGNLFAQQMNIISFNIRYNTPNDGENAWPHRIEMVNELLQFHDADIFGLQEALYDQISDIQKELMEYKWFGVGRDDGKKEGEFSPIFYKTSKLDLLNKGHFWLSENCEKPGLGWDAACNRIVTWGMFQSKTTKKQFLVFNTHFDHKGIEARENSAILIREKIEEMTRNRNVPVILTGDFNLTPEQKPISLIKNLLTDSYDTSENKPYGPVGTYNGFKLKAELDRRIDYIFVSKDIRVLKYAALSDNKNQRMPSDHLPVFAQIQLK